MHQYKSWCKHERAFRCRSPQVDKLGKEDIWPSVQTLMAVQTLKTVIGTGVRSVHVAMNMDHEAFFKFVRADESECILRLRCINRGRGRGLRIYM